MSRISVLLLTLLLWFSLDRITLSSAYDSSYNFIASENLPFVSYLWFIQCLFTLTSSLFTDRFAGRLLCLLYQTLVWFWLEAKWLAKSNSKTTYSNDVYNHSTNYKNFNFLDCDQFDLFSTNSLANLLSDSLLSNSLLSDSLLSDSLISQSHSKL